MKTPKLLIAAGMATALASFAYAQGGHHGHQTGGGEAQGDHAAMHGMMQEMMQDMMPSPDDSPATRASKEAHMTMMRDMHIEYSGEPDIDFARAMIPHHKGAVEMARIQLEHGTDAEMRALAEEIIAAQEREIEQLETWLAEHDAD